MMVDFDKLSQDEQLIRVEAALVAGLDRFGLESDCQIQMINHSENTTYRIESPGRIENSGRTENPGAEPCVIRVHREDYHSRRGIECELAWMQALNDQAGVPTPRPIPGLDGEVIQTVAGHGLPRERYAVRFAWIDGEAPDENKDLIAPFIQLGEVTARTHVHSKSWLLPADFERLRWDFEATLGGNPNWGRWEAAPGLDGGDHALLERCAQLIGARLTAFGQAPARFGLIHADFRLANLLVHNGETRVIDFDDCGIGWYLYDLASALSFMEERTDLPELIAAWCEGYRRIQPIDADEEAEIRTFLMLRRMLILAWMGSHAETDLAKELGGPYIVDTMPLAEAYLSSHG
ncbi:MAG: phosphotransferase [Alphaproteobacteria bacterium]|jgi:Ser/Thr protein kinase RdoA (MazF antagonist)